MAYLYLKDRKVVINNTVPDGVTVLATGARADLEPAVAGVVETTAKGRFVKPELSVEQACDLIQRTLAKGAANANVVADPEPVPTPAPVREAKPMVRPARSKPKTSTATVWTGKTPPAASPTRQTRRADVREAAAQAARREHGTRSLWRRMLDLVTGRAA